MLRKSEWVRSEIKKLERFLDLGSPPEEKTVQGWREDFRLWEASPNPLSGDSLSGLSDVSTWDSQLPLFKTPDGPQLSLIAPE